MCACPYHLCHACMHQRRQKVFDPIPISYGRALIVTSSSMYLYVRMTMLPKLQRLHLKVCFMN